MLTLYLVRHGQTAHSRENRFCGSSTDLPLLPEGQEMAEALATYYAGETWQAIYTSPLSRAVETAEPLARRVGLRLRIEAGLREIAYGEWEGLMEAEIRRRSPEALEAWVRDPGRCAPP